MKKPSIQLGVPAIDREHLAIDALLERATASTDTELPLLLGRNRGNRGGPFRARRASDGKRTRARA